MVASRSQGSVTEGLGVASSHSLGEEEDPPI